MKTGRPKMSQRQIVDNFLSRINKNPIIGNTECWIWTGSTIPNGYGQFSCGNGKTILAHRFAFQLWRGDIPKGFLVLHKCDNKFCVNPNHLFVGTEKDNIDDAAQKKRLRFGEIHHNSKMSDEQIAFCRRSWKSEKDTSRLAIRFLVHKTTIQRIVSNKTRMIPTSETVFAHKLFSK